MDAFLVYVNDNRRVSVELVAGSAISFRVEWIGNSDNGINLVLSRREDEGAHAWNLGQVFVGETVSFLTAKTNETNGPTQFLTNAELVNERKTKAIMTPEKKGIVKTKIGTLSCHVNNKEIGEIQFFSDNVFLVHFIWVGDSKGHSIMHMGLGGSSLAIPEIKFGDKVTFGTKRRDSKGE